MSRNILIIHDGQNPIRGSEKVVLTIVDGLDQSRYRIAAVLTSHPDLAASFRERGIATIFMPFEALFLRGLRMADIRQFPRMLRIAARLMREHRIDLVYVNNGGACPWACAAAWWRSVPLLVHVHAPWSYKQQLALGLHHADRVVSVSHALSRDYLTDPTLDGRVAVVYNGIGRLEAEVADRDAARLQFGLAPDDIAIGVAAILLRRKRVDIVIEALRLLPGELRQRAKLLIMGDGPERETLERQSAGLPVLFLGQRNDVHHIMLNVLDIFALASEMETFGLALLEAGAAGLPRVGVDWGAIPEVILDGMDGIVVPPNDAPALSNALAALARSPAEAKRLGAAAKARAYEHFTLDRQMRDFMAVCDELTAAGALARSRKVGQVIRSVWCQLRSVRRVAAPAAR